MKKALVTGGLGFIGYHLSARLLAEGFEVQAVDNRQRGSIDAHVHALIAHSHYRLILGDLMDDGCIKALGDGFTHVFHLAAIVGVKNVVQQPYRVLTKNAFALARVLEWSQRQRGLQRFVFPSTSEVYAGTLEAFGMKIPTPENTPLVLTDLSRSRTSYLLSKIYGEALCHYAGIPFTLIRPHNVYGPRMGMAHVIPELLERAHRSPARGKLRVFSPRHKRAFCYIDDAIELMVRLALLPGGLNGTFNIGSSAEELSIAALAELVMQTVDKPLAIEMDVETEGSPERRCPDIGVAVAVTSYEPRIPLREGLRRTYKWYRATVFDSDQTREAGAVPTCAAAGPYG